MVPESPAERGQRFPVGIDLGTTYSVLAYIEETGKPRTVANDLGDLLTPSAVLVEDGEVVVGKAALKSSTLLPGAYAECFKRDMGQLTYRKEVRGVSVPPTVLSALILEKLKRDAEPRLGPIREVVVTVPAFFDENRRRATQEAARLAGLEVLDIINEPTAAALAYAAEKGVLRRGDQAGNDSPERILVYDLGGGTFDATILEIRGSQFRTLATDGDVQLGGKDFDERIVNYVADHFRRTHGVDPRTDLQDAAQLWLDAQEAKHDLSQKRKTSLVCFHRGIRERIELTQEIFADLIRDLVDRTVTTSSLTVREAGLGWKDIDRILLVGGSSRIPMIVDALRKESGKEPDRSQSPDEAVAHGAAIYADMLSNNSSSKTSKKYELVNVNSHSLGVVGIHVKTQRKTNVILIPKNTPLPAKAVRSFRTARANQPDVKVQVVEGESHRPEDCISLGKCVVRNLPSGLPKGTRVEVEYRYASNGRISVLARVPASRQSATVEIHREIPDQHEDLETWKRRLKAAKPAPGSGNRPRPIPGNHPRPIPANRPQPIPGNAPRPIPDNRPRPIPMAAPATPRLATPGTLEQLYQQIGTAALEADPPRKLRAFRDAARAAVHGYHETQAKLQVAEQHGRAAMASPEQVKHEAQLAQLRREIEAARQRADLSLQVLGRECLGARFHPPGAETAIAEAERLQAIGQE